jgi:flagellar biosynthesis/type III secretory pathway protein FliH
MKRIDQSLMELKTIEGQIEALTNHKEELRKEVFGIIENEGLTDGYKNEYATVSYVERKTVKIKDQEKLLNELKEQKLVKYFEEVPEQIIPAHLEVKPTLTKDIKDGKFTSDLVEVETSNNLAVRFN